MHPIVMPQIIVDQLMAGVLTGARAGDPVVPARSPRRSRRIWRSWRRPVGNATPVRGECVPVR
jgi:hypothetical protein